MYGEGQLLTDEDWSNRIAAQEVIYELINKIVDYGRQESLWNIIEHFDLIGDR
jgi:NADH:ubiquinone oxidoreductase subunit B-like Fe-S oxidoreductase